MKENLSFKNIREFEPGDTLYMHLSEYSGGMRHSVVMAEFISFEKGIVTGKIIEVEKDASGYKKQRIEEGWIEKTRLGSCSLYGKGANEDHEFFHYFDPIGHAIYNTAEERHLRVPKEHPSYGTLSINRVTSSNSTPCFGSPILHNHTIRLKINKAELNRSLHEDRFFPREQMIEVEMTPQQFAEMLTSPNSMGTPVTIKAVNRESVEETPFISKLDQFETELKEKVKSTHSETKQKLANIAELLNSGKPVGKKDREYINKLISSINQDVESNFPFLQTQMIEEMGRVVGEAKAQIQQTIKAQAKAYGLPDNYQPPTLLEMRTEERE